MQVQVFHVVPKIPAPLSRLRELAFNLLWSWDENLRDVFLRIDRELFERLGQDPVQLLAQVPQERLEHLTGDAGFLTLYQNTLAHFDSYLADRTWWDRRYGSRPLIAYFSAEYGLTECLPLYSGGLGVLAGHHLKSASDLGVPLVGVGLCYQQGYFHQYLTNDGWQQESYTDNDFHAMPLEQVLGPGGAPLRIAIPMAGRTILVQAWKAIVGRLSLFLLDTNVPGNTPDQQRVTSQLYGGDDENRIRQEIVLGIAGMRLLRAMGLEPSVCHMNEGHSAFLSLERIRMLMRDHDLPFDAALEAARAGAIFTTHTPVQAGFDVFPRELMARYFADYAEEVGLTFDQFLALGHPARETGGSFNMAGLAIRTSAHVNGVSELHGKVSRSILGAYAPGVPEHEVPIGHVTNGAHTRSCISREAGLLFDRYLGGDWWKGAGDPDTWQNIEAIPDEELWATHSRQRERLVSFTRRRLAEQVARRGGTPRDLDKARAVLSTRALTIGFARRFATYKRADLILKDLERLGRILKDPDRPVQFIFAGKAHPKDHPGKEVMKAIVDYCNQEDIRTRVAFIEDYDLLSARFMVQGCDVWLNTPRRGLEASGTSGMKILANGGINLSIPDGWWCEGYTPEVGWAIGRGEDYDDYAYQDHLESDSLYNLLEKEVIPLFYERGTDGMPKGWIARMKASMRVLTPIFSTNRMLAEYVERYYLPAAEFHSRLAADGFARARALAAWKTRLRAAWGGVQVVAVAGDDGNRRIMGDALTLTATVRLGSLRPDEVSVEVYYGRLDSRQELVDARVVPLAVSADLGDGVHRYEGSIPCDRVGQRAYTVRVRPDHPDANNFFSTELMTWQ